VAGILNTAKRIHFFVLCNEELNCEDYIEKCIVTKSAVFVTSQIHYVVIISYQGGSISIYFETRLFPKLPSELVFAQRVLKKIQLGCLS
jgi:hypothetical protein